MKVDKLWKVKDVDEKIIEQLKEQIKLKGGDDVIYQLLMLRGVTNFESGAQYCNPQKGPFHNPYLMKDMEKAVERIQQTANKQEAIMIYGDYDVDGTTAVATVYDFLRKNLPNYNPSNIHYYIPNRSSEGYGLTQQGIQTCVDLDIKLVITLDCGIKSVEEVEQLHNFGIDVIICDHHLLGATVPKAIAILNPKQPDCEYPFKELSGCGIGYKLIEALSNKWQLPEEAYKQYLDLVVISIAADIVPMLDENRALAYLGLKKINTNPSPAVDSLKRLSKLHQRVKIENLIFGLAPFINAVGRMDDAKKVISFFIESNNHKSNEIAHKIKELNDDRRVINESINKLAHKQVSLNQNKDEAATVVYHEDWHKGVLGIVASKLVDEYYKPTIVLTKSNGLITGSARSIEGFNMHEAFKQCDDLLENYGGHYFAAGLTMKPEHYETFVHRFQEIASKALKGKMPQPTLAIDAVLRLNQVTDSLYNTICRFEPFGPDNLKPIFISRNVMNAGSNLIKDKHIRFKVKQQDSKILDGIAFNLADKFNIIKDCREFDIVYTIERNIWKNQQHLQLFIIDIKPANHYSS